MPVVSTRAFENGKITIDRDKCVNCGICAAVCVNGSMSLNAGKIELNENTVLGCFACGQCVAACPADAIAVEGRCLSASDFEQLSNSSENNDNEAFMRLVKKRRSIRAFDEARPVGQHEIKRIIECASYAPPSAPPSEVQVLVVNDRRKVADLATDLMDGLKKKKLFISPALFKMMKPFMSRYKYQSFMTFLIPWMNALLQKREEGKDWLFYDAPLFMFFYAEEADLASDVFIAATYAMLAAEAEGLGTCMIGSAAPLFGFAGADIRKKYRITSEPKTGLGLIIGYPRYKYGKTVKRSFKSLRYY